MAIRFRPQPLSSTSGFTNNKGFILSNGHSYLLAMIPKQLPGLISKYPKCVRCQDWCVSYCFQHECMILPIAPNLFPQNKVYIFTAGRAQNSWSLRHLKMLAHWTSESTKSNIEKVSAYRPTLCFFFFIKRAWRCWNGWPGNTWKKLQQISA